MPLFIVRCLRITGRRTHGCQTRTKCHACQIRRTVSYCFQRCLRDILSCRRSCNPIAACHPPCLCVLSIFLAEFAPGPHIRPSLWLPAYRSPRDVVITPRPLLSPSTNCPSYRTSDCPACKGNEYEMGMCTRGFCQQAVLVPCVGGHEQLHDRGLGPAQGPTMYKSIPLPCLLPCRNSPQYRSPSESCRFHSSGPGK
jgi:hypothetical protein